MEELVCFVDQRKLVDGFLAFFSNEHGIYQKIFFDKHNIKILKYLDIKVLKYYNIK